MNLVFTTRFDRDLKRLVKVNPPIKFRVEKTLKLLSQDINHPSLRVHKLSGKQNVWSVSVTMSIRIILKMRSSQEIRLFRIGTHEDVY
jgi:mRNA-degrading endonuclease YafQ of YafQ-DinJ toxin-antitoxin module